MPTRKFGLFVNLDYAHKAQDSCSLIWQIIMAKMLENGFSFQKRAFAIHTEKSRDEVSKDVRRLFDEIHTVQPDIYSYIVDCYILNFDNCSDLTLPDTSNSIDVEDITLQDLNSIGIEYDLLFKNHKSK